MKQTLVFIFIYELNAVLADCSTYRKRESKIEHVTDGDTVSQVQSHIFLIISALTLD